MAEKSFDAVKMMRELRDQLSRELEHMTPEEQIRYIREKAKSTDLGKQLARRTDGIGECGREGSGVGGSGVIPASPDE